MSDSVSIYAGKHALVTGSRRGVGRMIVEHILQNGGSVAGFARGESTLTHPHYHHFQVDISDPVAVSRGFAALKKVFDSLHVVVNNAAVLTSQYAMVMPPMQAQAMINTNLLGAFMVAREASKLMRKNKWGRIINMSSMAVSIEPIGDSVYAASKSGLISLANVMAKELAPLNITCNTLGLTAIETDMLAQLPQGKVAKVIADLPIPRYAKASDIFNVLDFFASERSGYITAQTVYLGGVN